MPTDPGALHLLLAGPDQSVAAVATAVLLAAAALIGAGLGRRSAEGAGLGLLVLAGGTALALFVLRAAALPPVWMAPLSLILTVFIAAVLRRWVLPAAVPAAMPTRPELVLAILAAAAFWTIRIVQVDPSSGLSSQLGWTPLYVRTSMAAGHFLLPHEFSFGVGPVDFLFYSVDMLGPVALAGSLGIENLYPVYLATSIAGTGLALAVALAGLRGSLSAQIVFCLLVAGLAAVDLQFQAAILRHWGDTILILGGTLIMVSLSRCGAGLETALRQAAAASVFLVLARHYGAFFSAVLMAGSLAVLLRAEGRAAFRLWPAMAALGVLLAVLSAREVNYILHPTPYYPGSKLLTMAGGGPWYHLRGALHDWGFMTDNAWTPLGPRTLWLAALAGLVWRCRRRGDAPLALAAPLAVMLLPALLHAATGYRSSVQTNKPYLVAVLFMAWYPAFALIRLSAGTWIETGARRLTIAAALLLPPALVVSSLAGWGPGRVLRWGAETYRARVVDLNMAQAAAEAGLDPAELAARPLMYFYCEPGMALRLYVGGDLRRDLDFWGATVQDRLSRGESFEDILAGLGWPNLYLSSTGDYGGFVRGSEWKPVLEGLEHPETRPWVDRVIRSGHARLIVVKRP